MRKRKFLPGNYHLVVRRSASSGLGLFTLDPIARGMCIIEYQGKVLSPEELDKTRSKYLFEISKKKTIDGSMRSNTARYINHSCKPNCEIDIWGGRVYVIAKRNIRAGEELSYDYDTEYFEAYIKPKGCRCNGCKK